MKNTLLKKMALLLTGVLVLGVTACGAEEEASKTSESSSVAESSSEVKESSTEPTPEPEMDYKDVEFRIGWWGGDARHNSTIEFIEEFEKDYKNLTIDVEYSGWGDYWTKMSTQAAGGELPDIVQLDYAYLGQYAEAGLLLPLDDYVASGALDLSNVAESTYSSGIVNAELVSIPCGVNTTTYVYNTEVAAEAGVTLSDTPTWDELIEAMKTVYEKTGSKGQLALDLNYHARTFGEEYVGADGKSVGISEETLVGFWQALYDGYENGYVLNAVETAYDSTGAAFADKTMWITATATNAIGSLLAESEADLKFITLPTTEAGPAPGFSKPSMLWAVTKTCENPDLAVAFINYYVNDNRVYEIAGMDRAVPISTAIREAMKPTMTEDQLMQVDFIEFMEDGHASALYPASPAAWNEAIALITEKTGLLEYHAMKPEEFEAAAAEAIKAANDILSAAE